MLSSTKIAIPLASQLKVKKCIDVSCPKITHIPYNTQFWKKKKNNQRAKEL